MSGPDLVTPQYAFGAAEWPATEVLQVGDERAGQGASCRGPLLGDPADLVRSTLAAALV